jgi:hypothetical protein
MCSLARVPWPGDDTRPGHGGQPRQNLRGRPRVVFCSKVAPQSAYVASVMAFLPDCLSRRGWSGYWGLVRPALRPSPWGAAVPVIGSPAHRAPAARLRGRSWVLGLRTAQRCDRSLRSSRRTVPCRRLALGLTLAAPRARMKEAAASPGSPGVTSSTPSAIVLGRVGG